MPDKYLKHNNAGGFSEVEATATGGAGKANMIPALDLSGRLDSTMMPTGVGAETSSIVAFGDLAAGDLVNVFNDSGTAKVRKADASSATAPANGFVLSAVTAGNNATVYWSGLNSSVTGLTVGDHFLHTTPGQSNHVAPSGTGQIVQKIGRAVASNILYFEPQTPILLA